MHSSVPAPSPAVRSPARVTALLVSHDGERWLPAVIDGLRSQRTPVDRVVAVDTGSKDASAALLEEAFGCVLRAPGSTTFPDAVRLGLEQVGDTRVGLDPPRRRQPRPRRARGAAGRRRGAPRRRRARPQAARVALAEAAPRARRHDLRHRTARDRPRARRVRPGPARRGPHGARGQHRRHAGPPPGARGARRVRPRSSRSSATTSTSAGAPRRRDTGPWSCPQAVVFHAEAAHRGIRRTPLTGRHTHYQERRAALYTLLVNSQARTLPFQVVRLGLGTLLRMLGFLLVRSVGEALDELAALVSLYSRPREILAARRSRQGRHVADPAAVQRLLAPTWLPYRHGLDFVGDLAAAATNQAQDVAERRRAAAAERHPTPPPRRPVTDDEDALGEDTGAVARFLTNPVAARADPVRGPGRGRGPRRVRQRVRRRPVAGAGPGVRLVAAPRGVVAPARAGHRGAGPGVPAAPGRARHPARRQPDGGGHRAARAGRAGRAVGRLALPPRRRSPGLAGGRAALARPLGCHDVRPGPGRERRLGRRALRHGGGRGAAALAGACRARLRRSRSRPPLARRVALRPVPRARGRVRARRLVPRRAARPRRHRRRVRDRAGRGARPLGVGSARHRPGDGARAAVAVVDPRPARGRGRGTGPRGGAPAEPPGRLPSTCSPAGSATWVRRRGWEASSPCSPCSRSSPG